MSRTSKAPDPDRVIDLGRRLKDARALVSALEGQWEALFKPESIDEDGGTESERAERSSYANRITAFLSENFLNSYTADEVATALGLKLSSVASILSRLVREGKIAKRGYSKYGTKDEETIFAIQQPVTPKVEEATEVAP